MSYHLDPDDTARIGAMRRVAVVGGSPAVRAFLSRCSQSSAEIVWNIDLFEVCPAQRVPAGSDRNLLIRRITGLDVLNIGRGELSSRYDAVVYGFEDLPTRTLPVPGHWLENTVSATEIAAARVDPPLEWSRAVIVSSGARALTVVNELALFSPPSNRDREVIIVDRGIDTNSLTQCISGLRCSILSATRLVAIRGETKVESVLLRASDGLVTHLPTQLVVNATQDAPPLLAGLGIGQTGRTRVHETTNEIVFGEYAAPGGVSDERAGAIRAADRIAAGSLPRGPWAREDPADWLDTQFAGVDIRRLGPAGLESRIAS